MAAEGRYTRFNRPTYRLASMGPRPDGRGRRLRPRIHAYRPAGVNGAAAGWPRKAVHGDGGAPVL